MTLKDFLKILDSMLPITIYYDGDEFGTYPQDEIPNIWLNRMIEDVIVDSMEDIGIGLQ